MLIHLQHKAMDVMYIGKGNVSAKITCKSSVSLVSATRISPGSTSPLCSDVTPYLQTDTIFCAWVVNRCLANGLVKTSAVLSLVSTCSNTIFPSLIIDLM